MIEFQKGWIVVSTGSTSSTLKQEQKVKVGRAIFHEELSGEQRRRAEDREISWLALWVSVMMPSNLHLSFSTRLE